MNNIENLNAIPYKVDRNAEEIINALNNSPVYAKKAYVNARPAIEGEVVWTILKDGTRETVNMADEGDWVITNPSGEQYIIPNDKFMARYEPGVEPGVYKSIGFYHAILNPYHVPIEIDAPWGSTEKGDANCLIIDSCNENGEVEVHDPYIIDGEAFDETDFISKEKAA